MSIFIKKNGELDKVAGDASPTTFISDKYNPGKIYALEKFCMWDNKLWKKIGTSESGITPTEGMSWTETKIDNELSRINGNLAQLDKSKLITVQNAIYIDSYNSKTNYYTIPEDGYLYLSADGKAQSQTRVYDAITEVQFSAAINTVAYAATYNSFFVKKGMKIYCYCQDTYCHVRYFQLA